MEQTAIYYTIIGLGALIGIMAPVIKLNNSITKLTTTIEFILNDIKVQDQKIQNNSDKIDDHEKRITKLEK